jgi:hypothetical protein
MVAGSGAKLSGPPHPSFCISLMLPIGGSSLETSAWFLIAGNYSISAFQPGTDHGRRRGQQVGLHVWGARRKWFRNAARQEDRGARGKVGLGYGLHHGCPWVGPVGLLPGG